jgi:hypothetical protein
MYVERVCYPSNVQHAYKQVILNMNPMILLFNLNINPTKKLMAHNLYMSTCNVIVYI